jgi:hypothetical protein
VATVLFDRMYSNKGNGFIVCVNTDLRKQPQGGFLNAALFPNELTDAAKELCAALSKIPGICGEIMIGAHSFETGIDWSLDTAPVMQQIDTVI